MNPPAQAGAGVHVIPSPSTSGLCPVTVTSAVTSCSASVSVSHLFLGNRRQLLWGQFPVPLHTPVPCSPLVSLPFCPQKGWIEGQPHRQGVFPASFVHVLNE